MKEYLKKQKEVHTNSFISIEYYTCLFINRAKNKEVIKKNMSFIKIILKIKRKIYKLSFSWRFIKPILDGLDALL